MVSVLSAPSITLAMQRLKQAMPQDQYGKLVGMVLDERYRIESKLGEGGMGVVFLATHIVIEKTVAVKVLKRDVARDRSVVGRFVQEAKAASRIGHPNIVDVTDFGTTPDGMTYSVMEYVDGETLHQVLQREGALEVQRALPIIAQLAKALGAAHAKGIVHRDLKPDNIFLVSRDGRRDFVKVMDFGIAKVTSLDRMQEGPKLTHAGTVFGTPEYMAPEQASGRGDIDLRVDIYALGTILYEMVVGRVPHKGETMVRTLAMQMLDSITPPRQASPGVDISDELEAIILKALAKKREQRYQTMEELLAALAQIADVALAPPLATSSRYMRSVAPPVASTLVPDPTRTSTIVPAADSPTMPPLTDSSATAAGRPTMMDPSSTDERSLLMGPPQLEPAFVRRKKPLTLDVVTARHQALRSETEALQRQKRKKSLWPWAFMAMAVFAGIGIAAALVSKRGSEPLSAAPRASTAGAAAQTSTAGAARLPAVSIADAGVVVVAPVVAQAVDAAAAPDQPSDGPRGRTRGKKPTSPSPDKKLAEGRADTTSTAASVAQPPREIQVITKPEGASLYIDRNYTGKDGTRITRPQGTTVTVECRLAGYNPGRVTLAFDGNTEIVMCRPSRERRCVDGLKNPFDDCPDPE